MPESLVPSAACADAVRAQLPPGEADSLVTVLAALATGAQAAVGHGVRGVYLTGSFALGCGDVHADVDFLVVLDAPLSEAAEAAVRDLHRALPRRSEHWAHNLEGSYVVAADLSRRADPARRWLYVDNGQSEMEWSDHDNTEVSRWVLHHRGLTVVGPGAHTLLPAPPPQALRDEAAQQATRRAEAALADPAYLANAWSQPHEVLTQCRLLYTATTGEVAGKSEAARWCLRALPVAWHPLLEAAVGARPDPWQRVHEDAAPQAAEQTRAFVREMTGRILRAAHHY